MIDRTALIEKVRSIIGGGVRPNELLRVALAFRRSELEAKMLRQYGGRVLSGPFAGMRHTGDACGSLLAPKLVGTYEVEIAKKIVDSALDADVFIDIGCAEGWYVSGVALLASSCRLIGIDVNPLALRAAEKLAELNGVCGRCKFFPSLDDVEIAASQKLFVLIDVDGSEIQVLGSIFKSKAILSSSIIQFVIESDYRDDGSSNEDDIVDFMKQRGAQLVEIVRQSKAVRYEMVPDITVSHLDLAVLTIEGRPLTQSWLIFRMVMD